MSCLFSASTHSPSINSGPRGFAKSRESAPVPPKKQWAADLAETRGFVPLIVPIRVIREIRGPQLLLQLFLLLNENRPRRLLGGGGLFARLRIYFLAGGSNTASITWMTPFFATMSVFTTLDLLTMTLSPITMIATS